jgi:hypothetical protein
MLPNPDPQNDTTRPQYNARYGPAVPPPEQTRLSELAAAFDFSPDVLPANRAGHVTEQQAAVYASGQKKFAGCIFLFGLPVFVLPPVFVLIGSSQFWALSPTGRSAQTQFVLFFCAFWALAFVIFVLVIAWLALRPHDYRSERVLTAAGIVSKEMIIPRGRGLGLPVYIIRVGQEEWRYGEPGKARFDALTEGAAYRVYYTRNSHQILSIEPG